MKDLEEAGNLKSMDSLLTRVDLPPFPPTSDLYPSLSPSLQVLRVSVHVLGTLSNSQHGFQRLAQMLVGSTALQSFFYEKLSE